MIQTLHPRFSEFFKAEEFLPKHIHAQYGDSFLFKIMDVRILNVITLIRIHFGAPVEINNWAWEKKSFNQWRGWRTPTSTVGALFSQHKMGRAIDFEVEGVTPINVRRELIGNAGLFIEEGLTTMEHGDYTPTWTHIDCRYTGQGGLLIVKP